MKQQNTAKKQRKEQKKLRQAMKDTALSVPRPLETYKKRPGERTDTRKCLLWKEPTLLDQVFFFVLCSSMPYVVFGGWESILMIFNCLCVLLTEEEEDEEEFLETLPSDMLDDEDLSNMASFIRRDLSSW